MTCDKIITSHGRQKKYLCDYCGKTFDKEQGKRIKWQGVNGHEYLGWWMRKFICKECFSRKGLYDYKD